MVSLSMMAKLVEAVRTDARLVLVGDPDQLASVEAGAVLGDIVGPPPTPTRRRRHRSATASSCCAASTASAAASPSSPRRSSAATRRCRRRAPRAAGDDVRWIETDVDVGRRRPRRLEPVRDAVVDAGRRDHRRPPPPATPTPRSTRCGRCGCCAPTAAARTASPSGPRHVERWLAAAIDGYGDGGPWYVGRPLLVTENDYALRLYNGDTGVVVDAGDGRIVAAFERGGGLVEVSPRRLGPSTPCTP